MAQLIRLREQRRVLLQQHYFLQKQQEDPNLTFEQRSFYISESNKILAQLTDLQKVYQKAPREPKPQKPKNKGGRPKRMLDSEGNPLYNNSPKPEGPTAKQKFLDGIKTDESESETD